jgi:membrane protease YdiL (CAAX protease family)
MSSAPPTESQWLPPIDPSKRPDGPPGWAPATALLAIIAGLGGALGAGLVIGIIGAIFGADVADPTPAVTLIETVAQDLCFIGAAVLFARMHAPPRPWQFGLRPTRVLPAIAWIAGAFAVLFAFGQVWGSLVGIDSTEKLPDALGVHRSHIALAGAAILVTVIAPIGEEFLFRGYVFPALRNWRGLWPAALITGLLFGALHVVSAPIEFLVPLAFFGALLCFLYQRTGSLYPGIVLHSINNSIAFGVSPDISWSWQIVPVGFGALALIGLAALLVRRRFGPAPRIPAV